MTARLNLLLVGPIAAVRLVDQDDASGVPDLRLSCLVCDWTQTPDTLDWTLTELGIIRVAQAHADEPHDAPYPAMVEKPNVLPLGADAGSLFGYDVADMLDRNQYDPAGDVTDQAVTDVAPLIAALLHDAARSRA